MIISKPHLCTKIPIWYPKYNTDEGEWEVWLSKHKVGYASPIIIIEFTKAKHLKSQRFAVRRQDVERCEMTTNGKIPVYKVPFSKLEGYDTPQDVLQTVNNIFKD